MRDPETIQAALTLAETGHLVFSTLHTNDAIQSIDRIIDAFPSGQQNQIRTQLSMSLTAVIAQVLIPRSDNSGRVAARDLLLTNDAVRSCIAKSQTHALYSVLELSTTSMFDRTKKTYRRKNDAAMLSKYYAKKAIFHHSSVSLIPSFPRTNGQNMNKLFKKVKPFFLLERTSISIFSSMEISLSKHRLERVIKRSRRYMA